MTASASGSSSTSASGSLNETHITLWRRDGVRPVAAREVSFLASSARDLCPRTSPGDDLDEEEQLG